LFNVLWTTWVVVGARLEERDLVELYGDAYRTYQRQVPMLLPRPGTTMRSDSPARP
jgi:protein-S-isoprenylcysteine O-methyltransferase Ste14